MTECGSLQYLVTELVSSTNTETISKVKGNRDRKALNAMLIRMFVLHYDKEM